jgi:predicted lipid-binding transport protein (Tim44 family)
MPAGDPFAQIKATDAGFSTDFFYGRVNEMFIAIQYAWMNRNMEPVRRFLADQQFTVLQAGVQELVLKGRINMLESIHIVHIDPVSVTREGDYDSVKLAITANCIDYTIDERTKEVVNPRELGDGKTPTQFTEHWTFLRKSGAVTKPDQSIQKCPNCGAPVTDGNYIKCAYCGVMMNDPTLDWVLMRIEQV